MIDWIRHIRKFTESTPFHTHTPLLISEELTALDAPIHVTISRFSSKTPSSLVTSIFDDPPVHVSSSNDLYDDNSDEDDDDAFPEPAQPPNNSISYSGRPCPQESHQIEEQSWFVLVQSVQGDEFHR